MKLADIEIGMAVRARRGYSVRPAVVDSIRGGRVGVSFTDVDRTGATDYGPNRSGLLGAVLAPNAITKA
jgi:hypothetical protein